MGDDGGYRGGRNDKVPMKDFISPSRERGGDDEDENDEEDDVDTDIEAGRIRADIKVITMIMMLMT